MSIIVRIFGRRLFHEHDSEITWLETFYEHDIASIRSETLSLA